MKKHADKLVFKGFVNSIDAETGIFYISINTSKAEEHDFLELEVPINNLSPIELQFLTEGAYCTVDATAKRGKQIVFSRQCHTQEDIDRAKKSAEDLMILLEEKKVMQFPFVNRKVVTTEDSDSFKTAERYSIEIPLKSHVGAFGVKRKHHMHEGVDLYAEEGEFVVAMEDGIVVYVGPFTGPQAGTPWWRDTQMVMIEGASGVIAYGEIEAAPGLDVGRKVLARELIGKLVPVLTKDKGRPMTMLHVELYDSGTKQPVTEWPLNAEKPKHLQDPTPLLLKAAKLV